MGRRKNCLLSLKVYLQIIYCVFRLNYVLSKAFKPFQMISGGTRRQSKCQKFIWFKQTLHVHEISLAKPSPKSFIDDNRWESGKKIGSKYRRMSEVFQRACEQETTPHLTYIGYCLNFF